MTAGAANAIAFDSSPLYLSYDQYTGYTDGTIAVRFVDSATGVLLAAPGPVSARPTRADRHAEANNGPAKPNDGVNR